MSSLNCLICRNILSRSNTPLVLKCGHSLCSSCVLHILNKSVNGTQPICPTCLAPINYTTIDEIPKNYLYIDLLEEFKSLESSTVNSLETSNNKALCSIHQLEMSKWCKTCEVCLCTSCYSASLDSDSLHPCSKCSLTDLKPETLLTKSFKIKKELINDLEGLQMKIIEHNNALGFTMNVLSEEEKMIKEELRIAINHSQYCKNVQTKLHSIMQRVICQSTTTGNLENVLELAVIHEEQTKLKIQTEKWIEDTVKSFPLFMKTYLRETLKISANCYAVITQEDKSLFGKLWLSEGQLHVSCFKEEQPPFNSKIIQLSDVCREDDFKEQNVYFLVSLKNENYEKKISIELCKNNDLASNFFFLCCGLKGPNYEGCEITKGVDEVDPPVTQNSDSDQESDNDEEIEELKEVVYLSSGKYAADNAPGVLEPFDRKTCIQLKGKRGNLGGADIKTADERSSFFILLTNDKDCIYLLGNIISGIEACDYISNKTGAVIGGCGVQITR